MNIPDKDIVPSIGMSGVCQNQHGDMMSFLLVPNHEGIEGPASSLLFLSLFFLWVLLSNLQYTDASCWIYLHDSLDIIQVHRFGINVSNIQSVDIWVPES